MEERILRATHTGKLQIGDLVLPCAVLEDGTRVLSERGVSFALGRTRSGTHWAKKKATDGGAHLPAFLAARNLEPYIGAELTAALTRPIIYRPKGGGRTGHGVEASLIPAICEVWLKARDAGALLPHQLHIALKAEILMRGLARVGIIALVDEATGYQEERDRQELHRILEAYISKELLPWTRRFPDEFYQELFRLRNWSYSPPQPKRPGVVGRLTEELVYKRLPPGVLDELKRLNPAIRPGRRKYKHHQFLTTDIGHPHLDKHLIAVITLMRAARTWDSFKRMFLRAFPLPGDQTTLPLDEID